MDNSNSKAGSPSYIAQVRVTGIPSHMHALHPNYGMSSIKPQSLSIRLLRRLTPNCSPVSIHSLPPLPCDATVKADWLL